MSQGHASHHRKHPHRHQPPAQSKVEGELEPLLGSSLDGFWQVEVCGFAPRGIDGHGTAHQFCGWALGHLGRGVPVRVDDAFEVVVSPATRTVSARLKAGVSLVDLPDKTGERAEWAREVEATSPEQLWALQVKFVRFYGWR